ncbi:MAG: RDD family protein [Saprospiraceae bacterium]|nr:RDD family protein [Saprospiraceae bacterium]
MKEEISNNKIINPMDLEPITYATFIQRIHAFLIDSLIFFPLSYFSEYNLFEAKNFNIVVLVALVWFIYKPLMEWKYGATLGKMAAKIKVVNYSYELPSFNQAMMRFLPYFAIGLSGLILNFNMFCLPDFQNAKSLNDIGKLQDQLSSEGVLICYMFYCYSVTKIFFNEHKQAFHDRFSQTYCVVVYKKNKSND